MIGYGFCASFCTLGASYRALSELVEKGYEVQPIMSEYTYSTDTRFQSAQEFRERAHSSFRVRSCKERSQVH